MAEKIRAGIIGLGYWGPNILRNFSAQPDMEVVMAADARESAINAVRRQFPAVQYVSDGQQIIDHPNVDAIAIVTPVQTHYPLAKAALQAGKHVWVEKPLTDNSAQAAELVELAEKNDRVLMTDHTFIYTPAVQKLKDLIVRGELGELYYYDAVRVNLGLFQKDVSVLWDLGPHDVSIMEHLVAKPIEWVQAAGSRHAGQHLETSAYLTVQFADNVLGHIHVNWLAPVKVRQVIVGGSKRMCIYDDNNPSEKIKVYDKGVDIPGRQGAHQAMIQYRLGDMYAPALPHQEALARAAAHFVDCIRNHATPLSDGAAGLRVVQVLEAAQKSIASEGQRVYLKDLRRDKPAAYYQKKLIQAVT